MEQAKSTNRRKPSSTVVTKRKVVEIAKDVDIGTCYANKNISRLGLVFGV